LFQSIHALRGKAQRNDSENFIVASRAYRLVRIAIMPMLNACRPAGDTGHALPAAPPFGGLYRNIWRHAAGARRRLMLSYLLLVGAAMLELLVPWLAAQALNALQKGGVAALHQAALHAAAIFTVSVAAWAMHGPGRVGERTVAMRVRQGFSDALYAKVMCLPLAWHDSHHSGVTQQRISQATSALYSFAQTQFVYLKNAVRFVGAGIAIVLFSRELGLIALLGYLLVGYVMLRFDSALLRAAARENDAERSYQARLLDFLGNISTVIALRLQDSSRRTINNELAEVFVPARRSVVLAEAKWCAADLLGVAVTWRLAAASIWLTRRGGEVILVGSVFMLYQCAQQARSVVLSAADNFQSLARTHTDVASASVIWNAREAPSDARGRPRPPAGITHLGSISTLSPQEADVFEATLRNNLAPDGHYDDAALHHAIHASAFDQVMTDLGLDLDAFVHERGANLSGGQRQRLCLAQAPMLREAAASFFWTNPPAHLTRSPRKPCSAGLVRLSRQPASLRPYTG
jgi:ABC-type multidrug transport system fused ATPase/permease subunit